MRVVCLPFAGGGAATFKEWPAHLPDWVDVCAVELPGRGVRFDEAAIDDPRRLIDDLVADLAPLTDLPIVLFGHSLGAWLAFALARAGFRADALVASGARAPHLPPERLYAALPREELVAALRGFGGTPDEILDDAEMVDLFLPMIRADFRLVERLVASTADELGCPLTVLAATDDGDVSMTDAAAWEIHAKAGFRLVPMAGGHFFLVSRPSAVLSEVRRVIDATLAT